MSDTFFNNLNNNNLHNVEQCIKVMNFIASIPINSKPCYNSLTYIQKSGWFTTIRRRMNGEQGERGIIYINNILNSCNEFLHDKNNNKNKTPNTKNKTPNTKNKNKNTNTLLELKFALDNSISGFNNLIMTYNDQPIVMNDYEKCKNKVIDMSNRIKTILNMITIINTEQDIPNTPPTATKKLVTSSKYKNFFTTSNMFLMINNK